MTRIVGLVAGVWLASCGGSGSAGSSGGSGGSGGSGSSSASADRHADLAELQAQLAHHADEFFHVPEATWRQAVDALDHQLDRLDDAHATVALVRLAAMLGDSHTRLYLPHDRFYPIRFLGFEDGLFVAGTTPANDWALGRMVVAVDGKPIARVADIIAPLIATDNAPHLDNELPDVLINPVGMEGLDLAHAGKLVVTVEYGSGTRDLELSAASRAVPITPPQVLPLHLQGPTQLGYWNKYVPEQDLVYIQYNACADDPRVGPFATFAAYTLAFIDLKGVKRVVIDLRSNAGGDSRVIEPLIDGLARRRLALHVYALIGRATFSSGLLAASELSLHAGATLVGAPTGGNPNSYGEIKMFELPGSHLLGQYSTKRFADPRHPGTTLEPDVPVHVTNADWFGGRDPAMDEVLAR